jgi:2-iminobutanoate/2-iminopropanoate deaminase
MKKKEYYVLPNMTEKPYSSAVRAGDFIFLSGMSGTIDDKGNPIQGIENQTEQCLKNHKKVLEDLGASLSDVVKVLVFITKAEDWPRMNNVYEKFYPVDRPARTAVVTNLIRKDMLVEMECIAYSPEGSSH